MLKFPVDYQIIYFTSITCDRTNNFRLTYKKENIFALFSDLFIIAQKIIGLDIKRFSHFIKAGIIYFHVLLKILLRKRNTLDITFFNRIFFVFHFISYDFHAVISS